MEEITLKFHLMRGTWGAVVDYSSVWVILRSRDNKKRKGKRT